MNIPLNGRIAIVDDQIEQALPLIKVFSKNQIPYVFYKGNDLSYLPTENSRYNDIRILFLDINLIDNTAHPNEKNIKAVLYSVIKKVISANNFPYIIIFWSRHQKELSKLVEELFNSELSDRKPIGYEFYVKSDFFPNFGDEEVVPALDLIGELNKIIINNPVYSYLLNWENKVHISAEKTLSDIFSSYHNFTNWNSNANSIVEKLGVSYIGKDNYMTSPPEDKVKGSFMALNVVFEDTIEKEINDNNVTNPVDLEINPEIDVSQTILTINKKLLFSEDCDPINYSGTIIIIKPQRYNKDFEELLTSVLKATKKFDDIKNSMLKIWVNVTPLCDSVQGKIKYNRLLKGLMIPCDIKADSFFNNEAIYTTPKFIYNDMQYYILLSFKHFFTLKNIGLSKKIIPVLRIRQHLLSEIQSRLSRHVNRQGVLYID